MLARQQRQREDFLRSLASPSPLAELNRKIRADLLAQAAPMSDALARLARLGVRPPRLGIVVPPVAKLPNPTKLFRLLSDQARSHLAESLPPNWDDLQDLEDIKRVMRAGIPLVWVPPVDVVQQLTAAVDADLPSVLVSNKDAVLTSCRERLYEIKRGELAGCVAMLEECIRVAETGAQNACQSLAASVWDTLLRGMARHAPSLLQNTRRYGPVFNYPTFTKNLPEFNDDTLVGKIRATCVFSPVASALQEFHGGAVPETYSRHATAHAVSPKQYTPANSLVALMLAVSLARELEESRWTWG